MNVHNLAEQIDWLGGLERRVLEHQGAKDRLDAQPDFEANLKAEGRVNET